MIPRQDRGVAGSLVMMTRTVGVVTAATVLMLIFQTVRSSNLIAGASDGAAFLAGFHAAFRVAAALPGTGRSGGLVAGMGGGGWGVRDPLRELKRGRDPMRPTACAGVDGSGR